MFRRASWSCSHIFIDADCCNCNTSRVRARIRGELYVYIYYNAKTRAFINKFDNKSMCSAMRLAFLCSLPSTHEKQISEFLLNVAFNYFVHRSQHIPSGEQKKMCFIIL